MLRRLAPAVLCAAAFAAAWPAAAQTTFVQDHFTVNANTLLEAHTPDTGGAWTRQAGNNGITINAAADNARNAGATDWNVYTNGTIATAAEVVVGVTVTFTNTNANNFIDLYGRALVNLQQAYSVRLAAGGANNLTLIRWMGGTPTTIATATVAITLNSATSIVFSLKNASKSVDVNGVTVASSTDNMIATAGFVGIGMQSNAAAQTIADDFFASTFAPTAVDHLDAVATHDSNRTLLEWSTARETHNLGFRIARDDGDGRRVPASRALIAGAAFMVAGASLPAGNTYRWIDRDPRAKNAKAWWIEDVDLFGHGVWHGPFAPRPGRIDPRLNVSQTFADPVQRDGVAVRTRLRPATLDVATNGDRRRAIVPFADAIKKQKELAASDAIKIGVASDGLYRVTRADLGLAADADLQTLHLFADGMEVPLSVDGDAILFYGRALDTASTATRIYWLASATGTSLRMNSASLVTAPSSTRTSFLATAERREKDYFITWAADITADNFVGPLVSTDPAKSTTQTLQIRHLDRATSGGSLTVDLLGSSEVGFEAEHRVAVSLNGQRLGEMTFAALSRGSATFDVPPGLLVEGDNTISLAALKGDADVSAVVSVAITYPHTLVADDDRLLAVVDGGTQTSISGFDTNDVQIVDVTDERAPIRVVPLRAENGDVTFIAPAGGPRTIIATASSKLASPASIVRNEPSSLAAADGADVVIITYPSFAGALDPLVKLRESQGLSVIVAKIDDVYDEFNYGAKDPQAIRSFLLNAKRWKKPPRYVLLVGDASFDERVYLGLGDFDFVPTKLVMSDLLLTASDTWYTDFDDDGAPDIPIGRLSARVADDVAAEVAKIVAYETDGQPPSRKIVLVSDADAALDFHANSVAVAGIIPVGFDVIDIDASANGAAAARQQLLAAFNDALLVNYIGHGSVEIWSNVSFFGRGDVANLAGGNRPPIVIAMTCLNGFFHDLYTESLAEALQRAPNGAVAVWASSALTSPYAQLPADEALLHALLAGGDIRLGEAVVTAQKSSFTPDIRRTFILFGDPAMRVRTR
ncbi:MAG TPA: C25 family cysteine peptidase [Thermoanaerobaculia bacterium]|jgi:hypothetical protein|nr:C25 family cysteine peptidase [Thermoanaerobaculia bacterium]